MFAKHKAFDTDALVADVAKLREICMGCTNCKGVCQELLQLVQLPALLLERREART